ncbi:MAG: hypothetical protein WKG07_47395 [Hymenobacter sp.]
MPFAEAARQQQFEAVRAALAADADAPLTVLLGNHHYRPTAGCARGAPARPWRCWC